MREYLAACHIPPGLLLEVTPLHLSNRSKLSLAMEIIHASERLVSGSYVLSIKSIVNLGGSAGGLDLAKHVKSRRTRAKPLKLIEEGCAEVESPA